MSTKLNLIKIFGGKFYQIDHILQYFPQDYTKYAYLESCVGGGSVYLNKLESERVDVINDINYNLFCLWRIVRDQPDEFINRLNNLRYDKDIFDFYKNGKATDPFNSAVKCYVEHRMSRCGMCKDFSIGTRLRGGIEGNLNAWLNAIKNIPLISKRLRNTLIYNNDALTIKRTCDYEYYIHYDDYPYLPETRVSKQVYEYEMTKEKHIELAEFNNSSKAKILVSGYDSELYHDLYKNWNRVEKKIANHSSQAKKKKTKIEVLWKNF